MSSKVPDPAQLFWTPEELATLSVEYYDYMGRTPGVQWDIPSLREMLPWRPGTVVGLVARPGHGKTTLAVAKAVETANQIVRDGKQATECVVYVSFDQAAEELEALVQAAGGMSATAFMETTLPREEVVAQSLKRPNLPIFLMGKSSLRRRATPRMTIDVLYTGLYALERKYRRRPRLIIIDYLQIVPVEVAKERVEQVGEVVIRGGELALDLGCPIVFCAQATQAVDAREDKMPTIADCQWSSALSQEGDVIITAQRPWLSYKDHSKRLRLHGVEYDITPELFLLRVEKQRFKGAGTLYILRLEPEYVRLSDMELERTAEERMNEPVQRRLL